MAGLRPSEGPAKGLAYGMAGSGNGWKRKFPSNKMCRWWTYGFEVLTHPIEYLCRWLAGRRLSKLAEGTVVTLIQSVAYGSATGGLVFPERVHLKWKIYANFSCEDLSQMGNCLAKIKDKRPLWTSKGPSAECRCISQISFKPSRCNFNPLNKTSP